MLCVSFDLPPAAAFRGVTVKEPTTLSSAIPTTSVIEGDDDLQPEVKRRKTEDS
jgi:hypothetical protein